MHPLKQTNPGKQQRQAKARKAQVYIINQVSNFVIAHFTVLKVTKSICLDGFQVHRGGLTGVDLILFNNLARNLTFGLAFTIKDKVVHFISSEITSLNLDDIPGQQSS